MDLQLGRVYAACALCDRPLLTGEPVTYVVERGDAFVWIACRPCGPRLATMPRSEVIETTLAPDGRDEDD